MLRPLRPDDEYAVLTFERTNREFFGRAVGDRGDAYFEHLSEHLNRLVTDHEAGVGAFFVLVDDDATVLGRFNLEFGPAGSAELGYRVAQHMCGRGVATATVRDLCDLAATRYGLRTLRAATTCSNVASQRVLAKASFVAVGPADPKDLGGASGIRYQRHLTVQSRTS